MRFLGLDIGTTRMKCGVYEDGSCVYADSVDYGEKRNGAEGYIDITAIADCAQAMLARAYEKAPYAAFAVSSLGESFVVIDEHDDVIYLPMLYTDPRGKEQADSVSDCADEICEISGVYPQSTFSAYKLMWLKRHEPEIYGRAKRVMLVNEYITYRMTGIAAIDYSQAARTGVFDVRSKTFSAKLCDLLGINKALFSAPVASGSVIGRVKKGLLGSDDVFAVAGGHDQVCAALGAGVTDGKACADGMGTVECLTAVYSEPFDDPNMGRCGYAVVPYAGDKYCTYMVNYSCGSLVRWWLKQKYTDAEIKSGAAFADAESDFSDAPTGILALPYFAGAYTPYQNISAMGGIVNLTLSDSHSRVYMAILEGLCYEMKLNLDITKKLGVAPKRLIAAGGGSKSAKWLQIKANIMGLPVYPLLNEEAGVSGAAMLAQSAMTGESVGALSARYVKYGKPIRPSKAGKSAYAAVYKKYKKLYKALKEFY